MQGKFLSLTHPFLYFVLIINGSQFCAMYCLVLFYREMRKELAPLKPLGKFLSVKAVVFFSFWQQIIISVLVFIHAIHSTETYSQEDVAKGLQDFIICIEMVAAAVAQRRFFGYTDFYKPELQRTHSLGRAVKEMLPIDILHDVAHQFRAGFGRTAAVLQTAHNAARTQLEGEPSHASTSNSHSDKPAASFGDGTLCQSPALHCI